MHPRGLLLCRRWGSLSEWLTTKQPNCWPNFAQSCRPQCTYFFWFLLPPWCFDPECLCCCTFRSQFAYSWNLQPLVEDSQDFSRLARLEDCPDCVWKQRILADLASSCWIAAEFCLQSPFGGKGSFPAEPGSHLPWTPCTDFGSGCLGITDSPSGNPLHSILHPSDL